MTRKMGGLQNAALAVVVGGLLIGGSLVNGLSHAEEAGMGALEAVPLGEKAIRVRVSDDRDRGNGGGRRGGDLDVAIRTEQSRYGVEDPIRFEVKGNKPFYLYLFNVDPRTQRAVSILPNQRQGKGEVKYPGDRRWRKVPNPGLEFYSDRAGTERVVMVASERYLDVDKLIKGYGTKALGDAFYESEGIFDWLDAELNSAYAEKGMEAKAIRVRDSDSRRLPRGIVVEELNLRIRR